MPVAPKLAKQSPESHRKYSLFVDIPPSPLHAQLNTKPSASSGSSLKENSSAHPMNSDTSVSSLSTDSSRVKKRKLSDASQTSVDPEISTKPKAKKPRVSATAAASGVGEKQSAKGKAPKKNTDHASGEDISETFPNGFFYCHQCNKKRDMSFGVQCTSKDQSSHVQNQRCKAKYCKACLKNRYGQDLDAIKATSIGGLPKREKERHVATDGYIFECPRCKSECNCRNCRKAKGLEPTGNLTHFARKAGKDSAADVLSDNPSTMGIMPGKGKQVVSEKKPRMRQTKLKSNPATADGAPEKKPARAKAKAGESSRKTRAAPKVKTLAPKPLPKPVWTRVPTSLTLDDAEARINVREFALRFASLLEIGKSHLEELEELSAGGQKSVYDDEDEEDEIVDWISEACVKSLVIGLLSLLSQSITTEGVVKDAIKEVRSSGANLNRIWAALASLRASTSLSFPDPLPPPSNTTFHNTRSGLQGRSTDTTVNVAVSAQFVPVINGLIDAAAATPIIRDEFDNGVIREKELSRDAREAIAQENTRWKDSNGAKNKAKDVAKLERAKHKQTLQDLEYSQRVMTAECIPRFALLGRDHEGRLYYALTPEVGERDAARQLLEGKNAKVRLGRRRGGMTPEERREMQRWSWFVSVWGEKPEGALEAKGDDSGEARSDSDDEDEDEAEETWWGFWDPEEIRKLTTWIAMKAGIDEDKVMRRRNARAQGGLDDEDKGAGVLSRASTASGALSDGALDATSREASPLSDVDAEEQSSDSDGESDSDEEEEDMYNGMRTDTEGRPLPTRRELRMLVKNLKEQADLLEWRVRRADGDAGADEPEKRPVGGRQVSIKAFYG